MRDLVTHLVIMLHIHSIYSLYTVCKYEGHCFSEYWTWYWSGLTV